MARGDQMVRQWQILQLLQNSRCGLRAAEIVERLDRPVSERTLFRDLDVLAASFGIYSEDGRWRASSRESIAMPLNEADGLGLALALDALAPLDSSLEVKRAVETLRAKVEAALPETARALVRDQRERQVATFTAPAAPRVDDVAGVLEKGGDLEQSVRIVYRAPGEPETERLIDPHALWFADGRLYVIAYCRLRGDFRRFAVPRIREAELTDETFDRALSFNARDHVGEGFGVWVGEAHEVELSFSSEVAHLPQERQLHATQVASPQADGSVRLTMRCAGLPALARWLAGTGGAVRVLSPVQLGEMVREIHLAGLRASGAKPPARRVPVNAPVRRSIGTED